MAKKQGLASLIMMFYAASIIAGTLLALSMFISVNGIKLGVGSSTNCGNQELGISSTQFGYRSSGWPFTIYDKYTCLNGETAGSIWREAVVANFISYLVVSFALVYSYERRKSRELTKR